MPINPFEAIYKGQMKPRENNPIDRALLIDAGKKIDTLKGFRTSGDLTRDYNYFLEITNRDVNYKKASGESAAELIKNLESIATSLLEMQKEKIDDKSLSDASIKFYNQLPQAEIDVINKIIETYK